jgi:hypothetical protein
MNLKVCKQKKKSRRQSHESGVMPRPVGRDSAIQAISLLKRITLPKLAEEASQKTAVFENSIGKFWGGGLSSVTWYLSRKII